MKLKTFYIGALLIVVSFSSKLNAQSDWKSKIYKEQNFPENVNAPLTSEENKMIVEVFGSQAKELVFKDDLFLKSLKHLLRNRIIIREFLSNKKGKLLSEVPLANDYNKNLERKLPFDKKTFNPLIYRLDFFSKGTYMFQVDHTDYSIEITSQYRNF